MRHRNWGYWKRRETNQIFTGSEMAGRDTGRRDRGPAQPPVSCPCKSRSYTNPLKDWASGGKQGSPHPTRAGEAQDKTSPKCHPEWATPSPSHTDHPNASGQGAQSGAQMNPPPTGSLYPRPLSLM